jgi:hypothetical protein
MEAWDVAALRRLPGQLYTLLNDPASNLKAAYMLYGIIFAVVIVVVLVAIMFVLSMPDDEDEEIEQSDAGITPGGVAAAADRSAAMREERARLSGRDLIRLFAFVVMAGAAIWIVAGYTSSSSAVCKGCHEDTVHSAALKGEDPHKGVSCVACHEQGGFIGRYATNLPSRIVHFSERLGSASAQNDYGMVGSTGCATCHQRQIAVTTTSEKRALKMSHKEPLAASVACLDCHALEGGAVSSHNAGMRPCLRCHDAKHASSDCTTCHLEVSAAARARSRSLATEQVADVHCDGCHDEAQQCDPCHAGQRMPHSGAFMKYAHARAAASDFWFNGGKRCARCHSATRNPCTQCHSPTIGQGHGPSNAENHKTATASGCMGCHTALAPTSNRDFCVDVCHSPAVLRAGRQ